MRIFVGMPLDEEASRGVEKAIKEIKRGHWPVRWESKEKWHTTAAFMGDLESEEVKLAVKAVKEGVRGVRPFELRFKGWGGFPDLFLPGVVWLGLKGDLRSMHRLVKQIRNELDKAGLVFDKKPFRGHMTIGRVERLAKRKQRLELGRYLKKKRQLSIEQRWLVDKAVVYESRLGSAGSDYRVIKEIRL